MPDGLKKNSIFSDFCRMVAEKDSILFPLPGKEYDKIPLAYSPFFK